MLIMKFKKEDRFFLFVEGTKIEVLIGGYSHAKYVIGVQAPKEVRILRENAKKQEPNTAERVDEIRI